MSHIRFAQVGYTYGASVPVFSEASFELPVGWSAVVGPNGAGKTTLLKVAAGLMPPSEGSVQRPPSIAFLHQAPIGLPQSVLEFSWCWDRAACRLRGGFSLEPEQLERWSTLSGGERQRWQVAAALHAQPDALLLDEPTNHLDAGARAELVRRLGRYRGVGIIVSHDRAFLDELTERVLWVEGGRVEAITGNYSDAAARRAENRTRRQHLRTMAQREQARLRREFRAREGAARSAERSISARSRMKDPKDSDGRSVGRKVRAASAAQKFSKSAKRMTNRVQASQSAVESLVVQKDGYRALSLSASSAPKDVLIRIEDEVSGAAPEVIRRGDRIRIAGPNGCGKTTLLERIARSWKLPRRRLLYLRQADPDGRSLLAGVRTLDSESRGRLLSFSAALGLAIPQLLASNDPSPGEARKLALAEGLARDVWCVVLDEPTNHLDLPSIEHLQAALAAYHGALVIVTHDQALAGALTHETWEFEGGVLTQKRVEVRS